MFASAQTLAKSNDPPPSREFQNIPKTYRDLVKDILTIEARYKRIRAHEKALLTEREALLAQLQIYRMLAHPVRRLLNEVLSEIFRVCVESALLTLSEYDEDNPGDTYKAPWVLAQVCLHWRLLAISSPQLWTSFDITWAQSLSWLDNHRQYEALLSLQMQRCRDQLISVSSGREQIYAATRRRLTRSLDGMFPSLHHPNLDLAEDQLDDEQDVALDAFADAPVLRTLTAKNYAEINGDEWTMNVYDHLRAFPRLSNIRTCYLDLHAPDQVDETLPLQPRFKLSFFHALVLGNSDDGTNDIAHPKGALHPLLDWLTLPALKVLKFSRGLGCPDTLCALFDRSGCLLDEVKLFEFELEVDEVTRVFSNAAVRCLSILRIGGDYERDEHDKLFSASDDVLQALAFPDANDVEEGQTFMLPRLRCLVLRDRNIWTDDVLLDLLQSRRSVETLGSPPGSLQPVERLVPHNAGNKDDVDQLIMDEGVKKTLQEVRRDGFRIEYVWEWNTETQVSGGKMSLRYAGVTRLLDCWGLAK
ncbi:hypothetical protein V5O48_012636 [Marasmius crinis-equi]|uniref:F-box domain-containing protein n=1 Tax=Marasmius crinis-equi TaxID=585013 RepID=A0ABR3F291_9AGAR